MQIRPDTQTSRLLILAPAKTGDSVFGILDRAPEQYHSALAAIQRFRGAIYLADGAIHANDLTPDGRHWQAEDTRSWHLASADNNGDIIGSVRCRFFGETPHFEDLSVGRSELARSPVWGGKLAQSIRETYAEATDRGIYLAEVGGWAVAEQYRCRAEALRLALCTFGLGRLVGGSVGYTTATVRHCSASILRRLGGQSVWVDGTEVPRYFDARYDCDMEILRFDSDEPSERYANILDLLCADLANSKVLTAAVQAPLPSGIAAASITAGAAPMRAH